ncbi:MAG: oligopeptide transporter, OPT family [Gemmataceae bacterium]
MATPLVEPARSQVAHKPFVPDEQRLPEFTLGALVTGTALGLIFAASSLYLVLKVGMTVSASIPVAVLAITLFRWLSRAFGLRRATILENNIVVTSGSAGESIAFGVGVTMPALLFLGFDMDLARVMVVSVLGGLLGILAMIPLRRAFIVRLHGRPGQPGTLLYPEGVAAAQVLISGEKGGMTGATVFIGFAIAFVHKFATIGVQMLKETVQIPIAWINRAAVLAGDMASELLGVGYIIGLRTAGIMMAGAVLGYLVIIPTIYFVGQYAPTVIPPSSEKKIGEMSISELRNNYLLYMGAGCVAAAGIISMGRTLPLIVKSVRSGLATVRSGTVGPGGGVRRTDDDMSLRVALWGSLGLLGLLAAFLVPEVGPISAILGALLVLFFGFLFVTVSARLTGEIGSTSNPISGMTTATLMITCLIFLALGMTSPKERVLALSVAAVVCIAASNGGTVAQALKTGFLVGGTPRSMQYAILIGALVSALVIGGTLLLFNAAGTVYTDDPQYLLKDARGDVLVLTPEELERLRTAIGETERYGNKEYLVFDTRREAFSVARGDRRELVKVPEGLAPEGRFLIDPETRRVSYLKDPVIGGKLKTLPAAPSPDAPTRELTRFDAPKTQVMKIIIDGVLTQKLNWTLVLIGAMIAITLELCGVASLPFAVGVYVPIQFSVPIFIGGLLRWGVDRYLEKQTAAELAAAGDDPEARARAEIEAIQRTETSPGVLLASGYVAGGSMAGVVVAFLEFLPEAAKRSLDWSAWSQHLAEGLGSLVIGLLRLLGMAPALSSADLGKDLLAVLLFAVLIVVVLLTGMGKLFKGSDNSAAADRSPTGNNAG